MRTSETRLWPILRAARPQRQGNRHQRPHSLPHHARVHPCPFRRLPSDNNLLRRRHLTFLFRHLPLTSPAFRCKHHAAVRPMCQFRHHNANSRVPRHKLHDANSQPLQFKQHNGRVRMSRFRRHNPSCLAYQPRRPCQTPKRSLWKPRCSVSAQN